MAEVIAIGASIIAIIQISDRVIGLCKFYIETVRDAPSDLRTVLIEASTMKTILENVQFLISCDNGSSTMLDGLSGADGPIEGCRSTITKMEGLFTSGYAQGSTGGSSKRKKFNASLAALAWPLKEHKVRKLVEELIRYKTTINLALTTESIHDIKDIKNKTTMICEILSESQRAKVYEWLQVTDPSTLHHRACKQYESGTGDWMLHSPDWTNWLEAKTRCIWIYGIPGAGKTVLASHLIKKIKEHCEGSTTRKCAYVYYYCYFGHNQEEAAPFLRWTINRLCRQSDLVPACLYKLYKHGGEPSLVELLRALEAILEVFDSIYIVTDAIDESMPRDDLLTVLRDLATDSRFRKVQLLSTSRQYIDIEKVMQQISISVSMSNPLLERDIKLYVRSQLHTNTKFKHWPLQLREEVVEALSTKANGMFRWAACQIHALQRLKGEINIVRNALENLPKTLDETYERIFLGIPDEDRMFVHHALKWIYYHNELHGESIPCPMLLQAIERSTCESIPSGRDYHYNEELLRDLCGCLITVMPDDRYYSWERIPRTIRVVSFAHYTVWEFLDSVRILDSSAAFIAVEKERTKVEFTRTLILEVLNTQLNNMWERGRGSNNFFEITDHMDENFNTYCVASSILSLISWARELSKQDNLRVLVYSLVDPSKPHFEYFTSTARRIQGSIFLINSWEIPSIDQFWDLYWKTPSKSTDANILIHLLQLDKTCEFARLFLERISLQEVFQTHIDLEMETYGSMDTDGVRDTYYFEGSVIEFFAQLAGWGPDRFRLLLELGAGFFDPSIVLLSFVGSHRRDTERDCRYYCPLSRLLQLGATPNGMGYMITPLQIVVASWDFEGVKILLEAGADPNGTADSGGNELRRGSHFPDLIIFAMSVPFAFVGNLTSPTIMIRVQMEGKRLRRLIRFFSNMEPKRFNGRSSRKEHSSTMNSKNKLPIDVPESRAMEEGRKARGASDRDKKEAVRSRILQTRRPLWATTLLSSEMGLPVAMFRCIHASGSPLLRYKYWLRVEGPIEAYIP